MIRQDLEAAEIPYKDEADRVFDFHSLRHQFISTLARSGAHPKEAQALARHSTITLTMDRYTHLGIVDLTSALDRLPAIPTTTPSNEAAEQRATGTDGAVELQKKVPSVVPRGAENGAKRLASATLRFAPNCTKDARTQTKARRAANAKSPDKKGASRASSHRSASQGQKRRAWDSNPQPLSGHLISSQAASQFAYPPSTSDVFFRFPRELASRIVLAARHRDEDLWAAYSGRPQDIGGSFAIPLGVPDC